MTIQALYGLAKEREIAVLQYPMPENGSMSVMLETGTCWIGMDPGVQDGGTEELVHLAHELGHCVTGSFYNRYAAIDHRQRHENRADKWAIRKLIPKSALDDAVASGCTELWARAEYFDVTEQFMRKAVCLYTHGNLATELYF